MLFGKNNGDSCVFCDILSKNSPDVVLRTDELAVLKDIRPASDYHYLVIPVQHISSVRSLKSAPDKDLVARMNDLGNNFIMQQASVSFDKLVLRPSFLILLSS